MRLLLLAGMQQVQVFEAGSLEQALNETLQVLDAKDQPIPGLYAAGSAGQGGLLLKGHGHHLIWAFTSGRLAGRYASRDALAAGRAAP